MQPRRLMLPRASALFHVTKSGLPSPQTQMCVSARTKKDRHDHFASRHAHESRHYCASGVAALWRCPHWSCSHCIMQGLNSPRECNLSFHHARAVAHNRKRTSGRRGTESGAAMCRRSGREGRRNSACTAPPAPPCLFISRQRQVFQNRRQGARDDRAGRQPVETPKIAHAPGLATRLVHGRIVPPLRLLAPPFTAGMRTKAPQGHAAKE
jgi:hypothetical protein